MREDTPSRTAAWVAAARHLGQLLPEDVRLADDPYGAIFTSQWLADVIHQAATVGAREPGDRSLSLANALRAIRHPLTKMPGLRAWILYMQVRTRVIDDALRGFVERHAGRRTQLLVLGAGYDCRALRMPELDDTRVFEIDHPATQGHKKQVFERHGIDTPATFVTWDFEQRPVEDLPEALLELEFDATVPTFTIWEGVTMYLSEPAIDASLRAITEWSAPGSELAMTYFAKSRLAKPSLATRAIQAVVSTLGEPWRWGWKPEELPAYLEERGLELVEDISLADAARALLPPELAAYVGDPDRRVAVAAAAESIAVAHRR
ncbi:MAG: SAM-dependent methyltransferase [Deltaproteobacteria bacterium]|nr:SAM-dependent methyltransferase [Deltaproteobacteria bacterium]